VQTENRSSLEGEGSLVKSPTDRKREIERDKERKRERRKEREREGASILR